MAKCSPAKFPTESCWDFSPGVFNLQVKDLLKISFSAIYQATAHLSRERETGESCKPKIMK